MLGHPHYHFERLTSTNDEARRLAAGGAPEGTLVTADFQSHGRGRNERIWESDAGMNFLGSYVLYPVRPPAEWGGLSLLAGIAVQEAVELLFPCRARVKWPNDVLAGGGKIAGVLIESTILGTGSWAVVGIGLNVNQIPFSNTYRLTPTSLARESGRTWNREEVADALSSSLGRWYRLWCVEGNEVISREWQNRSDLAGRNLTIDTGTELLRGRFVGINADGSLRLLLEKGEARDIHAGEIVAAAVEGARDMEGRK